MNGFIGAIGALFFKQPDRTGFDLSSNTTAQPAEPVEGGTPTKCTILAIDDDQTVLDTLRPMLRMEGFNVMTAISGTKGLDMVRYTSKDVKVVLLDYNMPRLSGLDTLQHLRKLLPKIKIVGLTGVAAKDLPEDFRSNVDHLMLKPYRTADLVNSINDLLSADSTLAAGHN